MTLLANLSLRTAKACLDEVIGLLRHSGDDGIDGCGGRIWGGGVGQNQSKTEYVYKVGMWLATGTIML